MHSDCFVRFDLSIIYIYILFYLTYLSNYLTFLCIYVFSGSLDDSHEQNIELYILGYSIFNCKKLSLFKEWCDNNIKHTENNLFPVMILGRSLVGYLSNLFIISINCIYLCPIIRKAMNIYLN
jgi:hypothetical protein